MPGPNLQLQGGAFQDLNGNILANGSLTFQLSHDANSPTGSAEIVAGLVSRVSLDGNGNVPTTPATFIYSNDVLLPSGTYYIVSAFRNDGAEAWAAPQRWAFTATPNPLNLGTVVPANPTAPSALTTGATLLLQTNGTTNSTQSLLNLANGTGISLTESAGTVTIGRSGTTDVLSETILASGSRAVGTVYQNTTGGPILVLVSVTPGSNSSMVTALTDSSASPTHVVAGNENFGSGGISPVALIFIVKANDYYKVVETNTGTPTLIAWREFSFTKGTVTSSGDLGPSGAGSRALATVYQNTSGSLKFILAYLTNTTYNQGPIEGVSDSNAAPTQRVWAYITPGAVVGGNSMFAFFPVLPGDYYKVVRNTDPSAVLSAWYEFTWAGVTATRQVYLTGLNTLRHFNPGIATAGTGLSIFTMNASGKTRWISASFVPGNSTEAGLRSGEESVQVMYDCTSQSTLVNIAGPILSTWPYSVCNTAGILTNTTWVEWSIS